MLKIKFPIIHGFFTANSQPEAMLLGVRALNEGQGKQNKAGNIVIWPFMSQKVTPVSQNCIDYQRF
jgi:hypothetical protein